MILINFLTEKETGDRGRLKKLHWNLVDPNDVKWWVKRLFGVNYVKYGRI